MGDWYKTGQNSPTLAIPRCTPRPSNPLHPHTLSLPLYDRLIKSPAYSLFKPDRLATTLSRTLLFQGCSRFLCQSLSQPPKGSSFIHQRMIKRFSPIGTRPIRATPNGITDCFQYFGNRKLTPSQLSFWDLAATTTKTPTSGIYILPRSHRLTSSGPVSEATKTSSFPPQLSYDAMPLLPTSYDINALTSIPYI